MDYRKAQSLAIVLCTFLLTLAISTTDAEPAGNSRPMRGAGGWTMNSLSYNAGLAAIQKLFGKRDGMPDVNNDDLPLSLGETNIRSIIEEFIAFLELKGSGVLGPAVVRCLKTDMSDSLGK